MAGIDVISNVVANLPNIFRAEGVRLWNREAQLVSKINKRMGRSPGVFWTVSNGGSTVVHRGEGFSVNPATDAFQDDRVELTLSRGIYSQTFGFTDRELATLRSYIGFNPDVAADLIRDRLKDAYLESLAALSRQIELDLLVGTGTANDPSSNPQNSIVGFQSALKTSGSYGGQSFGGSVNPGLISNIQSSVGNVNRADMDLMFASIAQATGTAPDFIMASPKTCTYLKGIADNQIRYNDRFASREISGLDSPLNTMGPSIMSYDGVPIYQNSAWGASTNSSLAANADGYVLFGQTRHLEIDVLPWGQAPDALLSEVRDAQSSNGEGSMGVGLPVRCWAYAKTAASLVVTLDVDLQLVVKRPNAMGLMSGVTGFSTS